MAYQLTTFSSNWGIQLMSDQPALFLVIDWADQKHDCYVIDRSVEPILWNPHNTQFAKLQISVFLQRAVDGEGRRYPVEKYICRMRIVSM